MVRRSRLVSRLVVKVNQPYLVLRGLGAMDHIAWSLPLLWTIWPFSNDA